MIKEIKYALTTQEIKGRGGFQWKIGEFPDDVPTTALVCFPSALTAVFMNPLCGDIDNPRLWECEWEQEYHAAAWKHSAPRMHLLHEVDPPVITAEQRVTVAINLAFALDVKSGSWRLWAADWITGEDRTIGRAQSIVGWDRQATGHVAREAANESLEAALFLHDAPDVAAWKAAFTAAIVARSLYTGPRWLDNVIKEVLTDGNK